MSNIESRLKTLGLLPLPALTPAVRVVRSGL